MTSQPLTPDDVIVDETRRDHAKAQSRGWRVRDLSDACLHALIAIGALNTARRDDARIVLFHLLADELYGNAAIDMPRLRTEEPAR